MVKKRTFRWFVEPLDSHTNEVLSDAGFDYVGEKVCSDGKKRLFWEAQNYGAIKYIVRSCSKAEIKFDVYSQEGNYPLRPWTFPGDRKKK